MGSSGVLADVNIRGADVGEVGVGGLSADGI